MYPQENIFNQTQPRRAWDEKLPDGRTVAEMIREKLKSPVVATTEQPANGQQVRYVTPDQHGALPQPVNAAAGGTTLPQPVDASTGGVPLAQPPGVGETDPLKREAARIRAMIENPRSEVSATGSVAAPHPMSRKKAALLGLLYGMGQAAQGGRNPSLAAILSGGATGAGIGLVKPGAIQDWRRRMEVDYAQGQLGEQTKLAAGQEQLEHLRASTEALKQGRKQYITRDDGVYEISKEYPQGRKLADIPAEVKVGKRGAIHYENRDDGLYGVYENADGSVKAFKVEGVPGKPTSTSEKYDITLPDGTVVKGSASDAIAASNLGGKTTNVRAAKIEESQSLYHKAEALDSEAAKLNEHIKKLEDGKATFYQDPDVPPLPEQIKPFDDQIADLKKQQEAWRKEARDNRKDGDKARAEGEAIPETVPTPRGRAVDPLKGVKWSKSKYRGSKPVEQAAKEAAARGAIIVD